MRNWTFRSVLAAGLIVGTGASQALAQTMATPPAWVALQGTAAPSGGNFNTFGSPVVNGAGQVAFIASLVSGPGSQGVFIGVPGAVQSVALSGTAAPAGGTFNTFGSTPSVNGAGQVAFISNLTGGTSTSGVFLGSPGTVQAAAIQGSSAPSTGGTFANFLTPAVNGAGQVAFRANVTGGTSTQGIFSGAPGSIQAVALQGTAAPGGGNYSTLGTTPSVNSAGQVAFVSNLTGGTSTQGIFMGTPGSVQAVALLGSPAPAGGNYGNFGTTPSLNGAGQVSFTASLTGGASTQGVFMGTPGAIQTVALQGAAAPAGGNFASFAATSLNGAGQVAFLGSLSGGTSTTGIFVGAPGAVQAAALQGTAAPGGDTYNGFNNPALNGAGQVAFIATLTGAEVTSANDRGLYAGAPGDVVKVVREGDQVDVDPSDEVVALRTVANINFTAVGGEESGVPSAFTTDGYLTYTLTFSDGSSGVFVSQLVPVPEPSSVVGLAAAGLGAVGWYRRRARRRAA